MEPFGDDEGSGTVAICFVREALFQARARDIDVDAILWSAGIPAALVELEQARVSPRSYGRMWHLLAKQMDDEFFGMDSHPVRYGSFALACHCAIDAVNLEQALRRIVRFYRGVMDDLWPSVERQSGRATVQLTERREPQRVFAHGTLLMILQGLACWLVGRRIPILQAAFAPDVPDHPDEYRSLFGNSLCFGADKTALAFDDTFLDLRIAQSPRTLGRFLQGAPANFIVKYRDHHSTSARVRRFLRESDVSEWPDLAAMAKRLRLAERTLFRRLNAEGESYQAIKNALRRDLSIRLLSDSNASVSEIASRLGFAEPSAFHRAFRKWTGASPGSYRTTLLA
jgi:AraC-like DNA-binding protein